MNNQLLCLFAIAQAFESLIVELMAGVVERGNEFRQAGGTRGNY
ncbi:hypothetical protein [Nostoc sp.]